jgi:diguanylate cyclase (GGDEF)-like protein
LLVIDGDPQARGALKAQLLAGGANWVDTAEDLAGGLAQVGARPYDAILLGKPLGASRVPACAALRDHEVAGALPVLLCGVPARGALSARALAAGASAVLPPDLAPGEIRDAILRALAAWDARRAIRVGLVAPSDIGVPYARALRGAGYGVAVAGAWPAVPADWAAAVAGEPPPPAVRIPVVPLWRGVWRGEIGKPRSVADVLESVRLCARAPAAAPPAAILPAAPPPPREEVSSEVRDRAREDLQALEQTARRLAASPESASLREEMAAQAHLLAGFLERGGLAPAAQLAGDLDAWAGARVERGLPLDREALRELADRLVALDLALRAPEEPATRCETGTVLLFDEDPALAAQLCAAAAAQGLTALVARDLRELPTVAAARPPDVAFVSAALVADPAAASDFRRVPALAETPVVLLVEPTDVHGRLAALRVGAILLLDRPLGADDLMRCARKLAQSRKARRRPRVAVLEDRALCEELDSLGFEAIDAADADRVAAEEPDAVVLGGPLATPAGVRRIRADPRLRAVPLVARCASAADGLLVAVLQAGADDAVSLGVQGPEMAARLRSRIERFETLRAAASHDPTTGLALRRRFEERLEDEVAISERSHRPFAVASVEPDALDWEVPWHAREALAVALGRHLRARLRRSDLIARAGGGELLLLVRESTCDDARQLLEEALAGFRSQRLFGVASAPSFTAGVASYPDHGRDSMRILGAARRARLEARRNGATAEIRVASGPDRPAQMERPGAPRILLVDPDENVRRLLEFALEKRGYVLEHASDGAEAARRILESPGRPPVDLVLVEVDLTFLNGFELLRRIRESTLVRKPRVIFLTARVAESDVVRAFDLGAADHLGKPFSIPVLVARLRAALAREGDG